jgi:hypothetical protein
MPVIFIDCDGLTEGLASDVTRMLKLSSRRRVSRIEPTNRAVRWMFYRIRNRCRDDSRLAEFTRRWPCRWQARILDGPILGPFDSRQAAIAAEITFLNSRFEQDKNGKI